MNIENLGEMEIESANDANIPVNCFINEPSEENPKWSWVADNFMPRKGYVSSCAYEVEADTKEDILAAVEKYVIPLYEIALKNLRETGKNYYWS